MPEEGEGAFFGSGKSGVSAGKSVYGASPGPRGGGSPRSREQPRMPAINRAREPSDGTIAARSTAGDSASDRGRLLTPEQCFGGVGPGKVDIEGDTGPGPIGDLQEPAEPHHRP